MLRFAALGVVMLAACGEPRPFREITEVNIRQVTSRGLEEKVLIPKDKAKLLDCLYSVRTITPEESQTQLLPTVWLIEVTDKAGKRSFELYTKRNLKGNKGHYYDSPCIHDLVVNSQAAQPVQVPSDYGYYE